MAFRFAPEPLQANLLAAMKERPKLGQHFLTGGAYEARIAQALPVRRDDLIVEIGAGRGALTEFLAERAGRVLALELDESLAAALEEKWQEHPRIQVVRGDILAANLDELCRRAGHASCYVFGNLPYYITSPILHRLLRSRASIRGMALLMQKEVAERLAAAPGGSAYGYLSVLCQAFSRPRIAFSVPPGAFRPPPKVTSALVKFEMVSRLPPEAAERAEEFLEFVKRSFAQKRKKLANNLAGFYSRTRLERELERLGLPATVRAEELAVRTFAELFHRLS